MRTYQHLLKIDGTASSDVLRDDGAHIPADVRNADWKDYLAWVTGGGITIAADAVIPPNVIPMSALLARFTDAEQTALWTYLSTRQQMMGAILLRLADGMVDLTGTKIGNFMTNLVTAGVITDARRIAILTP